MIALTRQLRFNGGGHVNHSILWQNYSPKGGEPEGDLLKTIEANFGSFGTLKKAISSSAVSLQGSGWAWLGYNKGTNSLAITTCANQDPLEPLTGTFKTK